MRKLFAVILAVILSLAAVSATAATGRVTVETESGITGNVTVNIGESIQLIAKATPVSEGTVVWKSKKPAVASVTEGLVTGVKVGKAKILANIGKMKGSILVTVVDPTMPTAVTLSPSGTASVYVGETLSVKATLSPATALSDIIWKSSNAKVASVVGGVITAKKAGKAVISGKTARGGKTAKLTVTVKAGNTDNTLTFGRYEQDNNIENGQEPIKWQVLKRSGTSALVISKFSLDAKRYNGGAGSLTWSNCSLRTWLDKDFMNAAFTADEQAAILTKINENPDNPEYGTAGGVNTEDRIYLLSLQEAETLFSSLAARQCKPTAYAIAQGAKLDELGNGNAHWWLRSPGSSNRNAAFVRDYGALAFAGADLLDHIAVRPVMWVNTSLIK